MRKSISIKSFLVLTFILFVGTKSFAMSKDNTKVNITTTRIVPGDKIEYTISDDLTNYHCEWYADDELISNDRKFRPDESYFEKIIKLIVYDSDNNCLGEDSIYYSNLPVLYIDTDDGEAVTSKETVKKADLLIQGNDQYEMQYSGDIDIKLRGNSSSQFPQKPYKIKLGTKTDLFGMGKSKHWVLISNYLDTSAMRNKLASELAHDLDIASMDMLCVDVVINGSYEGLYVLSEQIRIDKNRINIFDWENEAEEVAKAIYKKEKNNLTTDDRDNIENLLCENLSWMSTGKFTYNEKQYVVENYYNINNDYSGGYLFEMSKEYDEVSKFTTTNGIKVMLKSPEFLYTNDDMFDYTRNYWQSYEDALISVDGYNTAGKSYLDLVDFDSMVCYWLVMEITGNNDAVHKSRYSYKDLNSRMVMGPVWDFDWGVGSCTVGNNPTGWKVSTGTLWKDFVDDPYFQIRAAEKYWSIRGILEDIIKENGWIDDNVNYLKYAGKANDERYPDINYGTYNRRSFSADARVLKDYLTKRIEWLDTQFQTNDETTSALYLSQSTNPYIKSNAKIILALNNVSIDNESEQLKADGLLSYGDNLELSIQIEDEATSNIKIYVNGLYYQDLVPTDGNCEITIPNNLLKKDERSRNVISIIGFDSADKKTYTNYVTVIKKNAEVKTGSPYILNDDGDLDYDNTINHVIINQVYGGKKKESYASHSFIELYNPLGEDVDLTGWSLQYRSSVDGGDNTSWSKLDLTGTIPSHCSYLVRCKSIKDPVSGSIVIEDDKCDQEWNQVINNKGCSIVLVANNKLIDSESEVFDNENDIPVIYDYVDMVGISGNDTDTDENISKEAALHYEKEASKVQSKKIGIRRKNLTDTDDNTVDGDFEPVDYSFENTDYIRYISPKCSADGPWTFDEKKIPKYKVLFDMNTKDLESVTKEYSYASRVETPEEPIRKGYTFTGWYTDEKCTEVYDFKKTKPIADIILYAGWEVNNYTIHFETNGGSAINDITQDYGAKITAPEAPSREGYTFTGWYIDEKFERQFAFTTMPSENLTLYAGWKRIEYNVTWVDFDGKMLKSETVAQGKSGSSPVNPSREGYTFIGWSAKADKVVSDMTIEAQYSKVTVLLTVKYDMPEGDSSTTNTSAFGESVEEITLYTEKYKKADFKAKIIGSELPVTWSSSDTAVLSVSQEGKVTAKKAGVAYVYAESGAGKAACKVIVKKAGITVKLSGKPVDSLVLKKNKNYKISAKAVPAGKIKYSVKDKSILTITNKGKIKTKKKGKTYIVVSSGGMKKKVKVTVKK
ncbi:MAG: InlB B-repeat-containing protein [Lachnospiraceae bacterium]|nr:InlB B-repeat-containing protein [Lachnospiraceae bacterium]